MEVLKDLMKILLGGIVEWWAECKISSKRQEYFAGKKSKLAKICYYGTIIVCILFVGIGILGFVRKKILAGIICMSISAGIGMWLLVERGTIKKQ